jgi:hypothetical protein
MSKQEIPDKSLLEEVVDDLIIRMDKLENREIKLPDNSKQFKSLENLIKSFFPDYHKPLDNMKKVFEQQQGNTKEIQKHVNDIKAVINNLPKHIPVRHSLDIKAKSISIVVTTIFVILAFLSGFCIHLWKENDRAEANDIKFRAIRQVSPKWTHWADTTYARNPSEMERNTIKFENEGLERAEAEAIAQQKEDEVKAAKKHLNELKKGR